MRTKTLQFALPILTLLSAACGSSSGDGSSERGGSGASNGDGDAPNDTDDQQDEYTWPEPDDDRFSDQCTTTERTVNLTSTVLDPGLGEGEEATTIAADAGTLYYVVHHDQGINGDPSVNNARVMVYDRLAGGEPTVLTEFHSFEPPTDMILDGTHLYIEGGYDLSTITSGITRIDRTTGETVMIEAIGTAGLSSRAQTEEAIYFSSNDGWCSPKGDPSGGLYRLDKGTEEVVELKTGFECPSDLVLDGDTLFFRDEKDRNTSAILALDLPTGDVTTLATSSVGARDLALLGDSLLVAAWGESGLLAKSGGGIEWFFSEQSCPYGDSELNPDEDIFATPWGFAVSNWGGVFNDDLSLLAEDGSVEVLTLPNNVPTNFHQHAADEEAFYIYSKYDQDITIVTEE